MLNRAGSAGCAKSDEIWHQARCSDGGMFFFRFWDGALLADIVVLLLSVLTLSQSAAGIWPTSFYPPYPDDLATFVRLQCGFWDWVYGCKEGGSYVSTDRVGEVEIRALGGRAMLNLYGCFLLLRAWWLSSL